MIMIISNASHARKLRIHLAKMPLDLNQRVPESRPPCDKVQRMVMMSCRSELMKALILKATRAATGVPRV